MAARRACARRRAPWCSTRRGGGGYRARARSFVRLSSGATRAESNPETRAQSLVRSASERDARRGASGGGWSAYGRSCRLMDSRHGKTAGDDSSRRNHDRGSPSRTASSRLKSCRALRVKRLCGSYRNRDEPRAGDDPREESANSRALEVSREFESVERDVAFPLVVCGAAVRCLQRRRWLKKDVRRGRETLRPARLRLPGQSSSVWAGV